MFLPHLKFVTSSVPETIATGVLGKVAKPPILGKRRP